MLPNCSSQSTAPKSTPLKKPLSLLSWNLAYMRGVNGNPLQYHRAFKSSPKRFPSVQKEVRNVIDQFSPDIFCVLEIDQGNHRKHDQTQDLVCNQTYPHVYAQNKYGTGSLFSKGTRISTRLGMEGYSNAVFLKQKPKNIREHYFDKGTKRLIIEIVLSEEMSIFVVHLALGPRTRRHQLQKLQDLLCQKKHAIVCGDFNTIAPNLELKKMLRSSGMTIENEKEHKTYPSLFPLFRYDLFLTSSEIEAQHVRVIKNKNSDHRPIYGEFVVK